MASIKVKFRPSTVDNHEGTIYYQIVHERKVRQLVSDYKVYPMEWDQSRSTVVTTHNSLRSGIILAVRDRIRCDMERFARINRKLDSERIAYTADDVIYEFNRYAEEFSLFRYMENLIHRLQINGKARTSETYRATLNSFRKFRDDEDLLIDYFSSETMEQYEAWLRNRNVTPNTISFYSRILRAVYNRAVEQGATEDRAPFRRVYTGVEKTVKRALPLSVIRKIKYLDLSQRHTLDYARDMFMISFYMRGMSFIDMAFLKKTDLRNGHVTYRRRKTGQMLTIAWTHEMQDILDKYPENSSIYLLPIIRNAVCDERTIYRNMSYNVNHSLKKIADILKLNAGSQSHHIRPL